MHLIDFTYECPCNNFFQENPHLGIQRTASEIYLEQSQP